MAASKREGVDTDRAAESSQQAAQNVSEPSSDDVVIVKADEQVSQFKAGGGGDGGEFVTLTKQVVQEFYFPGTKRPSYRVLFNAGDVVRKAVIDEINTARRSSDRDDSNPAGIDSTTLASGTYPGVKAEK